MSGHFTPGPWVVRGKQSVRGLHGEYIAKTNWLNGKENARLIAAAPLMANEMERYLPIIERAEADPEVWSRLTEGTGIATANGYRNAIAKALQP